MKEKRRGYQCTRCNSIFEKPYQYIQHRDTCYKDKDQKDKSLDVLGLKFNEEELKRIERHLRAEEALEKNFRKGNF